MVSNLIEQAVANNFLLLVGMATGLLLFLFLFPRGSDSKYIVQIFRTITNIFGESAKEGSKDLGATLLIILFYIMAGVALVLLFAILLAFVAGLILYQDPTKGPQILIDWWRTIVG